jgi:NAD(P)H-flavin reductase/ferredoxin
MSSSNLLINGKTVRVRAGDTLVSAALACGIVIPHDCLTGQCDTCRVTLLAGELDGDSAGFDGDFLACQARVKGPASIAYEEVPAVSKWKGEVLSATPMAADVWEVVVGIDRRVPYLPGQYVYLAFGSLPERAYSPTIGLDRRADEHELVFHIRGMPNGAVTAELGRKIGKGARVKIRGPYGHAYLRRGPGRLVFLSSGTGFAPIWSMALASRLSQPARDMVVVTGARLANRLYMAPALDWLRVDGADCDGVHVLPGRAADYIPELTPADVVHVAGPASLVETVVARARAVGAQCYADPFVHVERKPTVGSRLTKLFSRFAAVRQQPAPQAS